MRLSKPRVNPKEKSDMTAEELEFMAPFEEPWFNIFKTLIHHPSLMRRWLVFANHILGKSTLPAREREIVILRIGYLCKAGYEWGQHVLIGRRCGLSDDEIRRIKAGPSAAGWNDLDRLLLQSTDELRGDAHISDATWQGLTRHLDKQQLMDLVFTVGQYNLVSMALNSFGVQLDPGLPGFDL
ncbi:MAG: carboxymuconolactone decarboxylase family protein [Gammaproteobacteria bacterium]|nr:carboxymuconolactone decarboxylase family protein [Gammaproteobacteria bacterium]